ERLVRGALHAQIADHGVAVGLTAAAVFCDAAQAELWNQGERVLRRHGQVRAAIEQLALHITLARADAEALRLRDQQLALDQAVERLLAQAELFGRARVDVPHQEPVSRVVLLGIDTVALELEGALLLQAGGRAVPPGAKLQREDQ